MFLPRLIRREQHSTLFRVQTRARVDAPGSVFGGTFCATRAWVRTEYHKFTKKTSPILPNGSLHHYLTEFLDLHLKGCEKLSKCSISLLAAYAIVLINNQGKVLYWTFSVIWRVFVMRELCSQR